MLRWLVEQVNIWVLMGALMVTGLLLLAVAAMLYLMPAPKAVAPTAIFTVIPAPTPTPTPLPIPPTLTPTEVVTVDGVGTGVYVQISGTEGAGLRLREGPGTSQTMRLVGMDLEVFQVKDGPVEADGFTWFLLEAPNDPNRTGWAVSKYLTVVTQPVQPSPQP